MSPAVSRVALLLDEMFSPTLAEELRRRGHDVIAVADDPQLRALTDPDLLAWATRQGRRLVTENVKDYRRLLHEGGTTGPALLLTSSRTFSRSRKGLGVLVNALDAWLTSADVTARPSEDWLVPRAP